MTKPDQNRMPILEAIVEYNRLNPAYFCIPGHRFERGINRRWREIVGDAIFRFDLTETPYTDDLHNAEGAIREAEELAGAVFGADYTHFLINGTTCGNQAMVLTAAFSGEKVAIPRNAHKSAVMGLIMSGAEPVYLSPELDLQHGIHGGITPQTVAEAFRQHPDLKGVMVVSPTYYGICSDLAGIAEICHRHSAILMVDEAHGAHCYFSDQLPQGALKQGADICAQSIHKVTGSLTQSSMIHVCSELVDRGRLEANLHLVQSTSPSYILLTSLDAARHDLANFGDELISEAVLLAEEARERINQIPGIHCFGREIAGRSGISDLDVTRLSVNASELGITGFQLKETLFEEYGCDMELADFKNALCIITFANNRNDTDRLVSALQSISDKAAKEGAGATLEEPIPLPVKPPYVMSPRDAYFSPKRNIPWKTAKGKIAGEMIVPYPPGIPVIYPGERVSDEVWNFVEQYRLRRGHLHGPADTSLELFLIIEESKEVY